MVNLPGFKFTAAFPQSCLFLIHLSADCCWSLVMFFPQEIYMTFSVTAFLFVSPMYDNLVWNYWIRPFPHETFISWCPNTNTVIEEKSETHPIVLFLLLLFLIQCFQDVFMFKFNFFRICLEVSLTKYIFLV